MCQFEKSQAWLDLDLNDGHFIKIKMKYFAMCIL